MVMGQRFHRGFTAAEKTELWDRWKRGESLKAIGRAFGKPSSSIYFLWHRTGAFVLRCGAAQGRSKVLERNGTGWLWLERLASLPYLDSAITVFLQRARNALQNERMIRDGRKAVWLLRDVFAH